MNIGFVGTGTMGEPIARRLLAAGMKLSVWNRTPGKCAHLRALGTRVAESLPQLFQDCEVILLMLLDAAAMDATLGALTCDDDRALSGRTLINLGTTSAADSAALAARVQRAGGRYVEAPVSGSRVQAEQGRLVAMLAGDADAVDLAASLLSPALARSFRCGKVPAAMQLKLAVNHFLIVMVAGLAEAVDGARAMGIDLTLLREVIDAGPMASDVSRIKLEKLVNADFSAQAAIHDVRTIAELVAEQAQGAGSQPGLMQHCVELYRRADESGHSDLDMVAVGGSGA